jgi:hypothetical protein
METVVTETKSVVLRQKMKSAFAKVVLAAKARGTAKEKAQQAFAAFADFNFIDGYDRHIESQNIIDDASLIALALTRLSPACSRVAITGLPHTVTVPDARTAEVFRAALAMSMKQRASDHLVKIVVAAH